MLTIIDFILKLIDNPGIVAIYHIACPLILVVWCPNYELWNLSLWQLLILYVTENTQIPLGLCCVPLPFGKTQTSSVMVTSPTLQLYTINSMREVIVKDIGQYPTEIPTELMIWTQAIPATCMNLPQSYKYTKVATENLSWIGELKERYKHTKTIKDKECSSKTRNQSCKIV